MTRREEAEEDTTHGVSTSEKRQSCIPIVAACTEAFQLVDDRLDMNIPIRGGTAAAAAKTADRTRAANLPEHELLQVMAVSEPRLREQV